MLKRSLLLVVIPHICYSMYFTPPVDISLPPFNPKKILVTNTNDAGPGSLRSAVIEFNQRAHKGEIQGINFCIPGTDNACIQLKSNIEIEEIIQPRPGIFVSVRRIPERFRISGSDNQRVTIIQGYGTLIIKCSRIAVSDDIVCIWQPKTLVDSAAKVVMACIKSQPQNKAKMLQLLPRELRRRVDTQDDSCIIA